MTQKSNIKSNIYKTSVKNFIDRGQHIFSVAKEHKQFCRHRHLNQCLSWISSCQSPARQLQMRHHKWGHSRTNHHQNREGMNTEYPRTSLSKQGPSPAFATIIFATMFIDAKHLNLNRERGRQGCGTRAARRAAAGRAAGTQRVTLISTGMGEWEWQFNINRSRLFQSSKSLHI